MNNKSWIGVDLDGTLAYYDRWNGVDQIANPVPLMLERVKEWLKNGVRVKIMTARVSEPQDGYSVEEITSIIQDWCEFHIGERLEVTCRKDFRMVELWDDRAVRVERNTGKVDNLKWN